MSEWKCPKCGSTEVTETESPQLKCKKCGTVFQVLSQEDKEVPPCPNCGNKDPNRETFTCSRCGDQYLCMQHYRDGLCTACHYELKLKTRRRRLLSDKRMLGDAWIPESFLPYAHMMIVAFMFLVGIVAMILTCNP